MNIYKRKSYLDILRGIGVFYVVLGHIAHISPVVQYVYSFHVPLFFFISGILFAPSKYTSTSCYIEKKVKSLLIPYFVFYIICLFYWYFVEYRLFGRGGDTTFVQEAMFIFLGRVSISGGALWFLPCLFCVEVLYWFIHNERNRYQGIISALLLAVVGCLCIYYQFFPQAFGLLQAFVMIPFFAFGFLLKSSIETLNKSHWTLKISIICIAVFIQYLLLHHSTLNIGSFELENYYTYLPIALAGIAFYLMLSLMIKRSVALEWLGQNSLLIFAFHAFIYRGAIMGMSVFFSIPPIELRGDLIYSILLTVITLLLMVPLLYIYECLRKRI